MIRSLLLDRTQKIVIAIDGTAGSGKGTLAKLLAEKFGLIHCQTSLFYRCLALEVLKQYAFPSTHNPGIVTSKNIRNPGLISEIVPHDSGSRILCQQNYEMTQDQVNAYLKHSNSIPIDNIISLAKNELPIIVSPELYTPEVTEMTSIISSIPEVRANLKKPQQDFLLHNNRVVMEGRDIGTVIAPNADLKLFITADLYTRAQRRFNQMNGAVSIDQIQKDIEIRDLRDSSRATAPLLKALNAISIDTTSLSPDEIVEWIVNNPEI